MNIIIQEKQAANMAEQAFHVVIEEDDGSATDHVVTLSRFYLKQHGDPGESPHAFVRRAFQFLLAREPKESILKTFSISDIERYFPEFPDAL